MQLAIAIACGSLLLLVVFLVALTRRRSGSSSVELAYNDLVLLSKYVSSNSGEVSPPSPGAEFGFRVEGGRTMIAERARVDQVLRALESETRKQ
jgi:hypothetical protein